MKRATAAIGLLLLLCAIGTAASAAGEVDEWRKIVNIKIKDMSISQALGLLMKDSGIKYAVDYTGATEPKITATLKNVTREAAFYQIIRSAGADTHQFYQVTVVTPHSKRPIEDRPSANATVPPAAQIPDNTTAPAPSDNTNPTATMPSDANPPPVLPQPMPAYIPPPPEVTKMIKLQHVSPDSVVAVLNPYGAYGGGYGGYGGGLKGLPGISRISTFNDKLVITGTEDALARALFLVASLDEATPAPKSVRVRISVTANATASAAAWKKFETSAEQVGLPDAPLSLDATVSLPAPKTAKVPRADSASVSLHSGCTITRLSDDALSVKGYGQLAIGPAPTVQVPFGMNISLAPGEPKVIAGGAMTVDGGKVDYEVTLVVTFEQPKTVKGGNK